MKEVLENSKFIVGTRLAPVRNNYIYYIFKKGENNEKT